MNIDGIGEETVVQLFEAGLIKSVSDLYSLSYDALIILDRMAEKSVENLLHGVQESKKIPFERVLFALGIRYVGETVAKRLAQAFQTMDGLMNASLEELLEVNEIGDRIAQSVMEFFNQADNRNTVEALRGHGLRFEMEQKALHSEALIGKSIVVSGVFDRVSREEIKELIELHGGKNVSSVSSKTDYLLAGEGMGPSKLKKATDLGVQLLNEHEFLTLIGYGK